MTDIVLFGIGALGTCLLRALETDYPVLNVVGVIDNAPGKTGKRVGDVTPFRRFGDIVVAADLETCLSGLAGKPDMFVHMTESRPENIEGQLVTAMEAGMNVISGAESMFYPAFRFPEFATRLDAAAKANDVTISGGGINPGFTYDAVPLILARPTSAVTRIAIRRCIDVTGTGPGDIEHVGYCLDPDEFHARTKDGRIVGHMGAPESIALLAEHLGIPITRIEERWETETADFPVESGVDSIGMIPPGKVIGITQYAEGPVITTELAMYYEPERFGLTMADTYEIDGTMPIRVTVQPAFVSIFGASNVIAGLVDHVVAAAPGLVNLLDLPAGGARRTSTRMRVDPSRELRPGNIPVHAVEAG